MKRLLRPGCFLLFLALLLTGCAGVPADVASSKSAASAKAASSAAGESLSDVSAASEVASASSEKPASTASVSGALDLSSLADYDRRVTAGVTIYKDLRYGAREDRADEGAGYPKGGRYNRHRSGQYYDVYVPAGATADTPVLLYLHGGSWCQEYDKDDESVTTGLAQSGFVVLSMDYILQVDVNANPSATPYPDVTFASMLRDVDAMVSHMKTLLPSLGLKAKKFAIAGGSAGAHLAALYAWDAGAPQQMNLALKHEIPVGFLVSVGGPLDMSSDRAVQWMNLFKKSTPNMARLITVMAGGTSVDQLAAVVKTYSPLALINAKTVPSVICYSHLPPEQDPYVLYYGNGMRGDGIVEGSSYDNIVAALEAAGVPHANQEIVGGHCSIDAAWVAATMKEFAKKYL